MTLDITSFAATCTILSLYCEEGKKEGWAVVIQSICVYEQQNKISTYEILK